MSFMLSRNCLFAGILTILSHSRQI